MAKNISTLKKVSMSMSYIHVATLQDPLGIKKLEKRKENKGRKKLKEEF